MLQAKIRELDDLYHITSMGFRVKPSTRCRCVSSITIASNGYEITIDNGRRGGSFIDDRFRHTRHRKDLFGELPAADNFLNEATEAAMVRTVCRKRLAYPNVVQALR